MKRTEKNQTTLKPHPLKPHHSVWVRWTHWINFPLLALMIWSGIWIYWANPVYKPFFPEWFYQVFHLDHHLALGMGVHFLLMWLFLINGALYFSYLVLSGEWRELTPHKGSLKEAWQVVLHDLGLRKEPLPSQGKFNAAQRIAYLGINLIGVGSIVTGLAIYKPTQLHWLTRLLGGYETARLLHFICMITYIPFFIVHVIQVIRAGWSTFLRMTPFKIGVTAVGTVVILYALVMSSSEQGGTPWPLRKGFLFNEKIWSTYFSATREAERPPTPPRGAEVRLNGDLGLEDPFDPNHWRLQIIFPDSSVRKLRINELRNFPKTNTTALFKCIEGWSEPFSYAGVRFLDFIRILKVGTRSGNWPKDGSLPKDFYRYVGLETPDRKYYVSIDIESMIHPQTLIAYEMNGIPLTPEHGAPARLVIPNKYGIKSLKRIGKIFFSDERPPDYWAEQGYDWYSGL